MSQLKFDKNGVFIPKKTNLTIKHDELDEEMINEYINNECSFQIEYDNESNPIFIKKDKNNKND